MVTAFSLSDGFYSVIEYDAIGNHRFFDAAFHRNPPRGFPDCRNVEGGVFFLWWIALTANGPGTCLA
jgi:hypothetical protein